MKLIEPCGSTDPDRSFAILKQGLHPWLTIFLQQVNELGAIRAASCGLGARGAESKDVQQFLQQENFSADAIGNVKGLNYSKKASHVSLTLYRLRKIGP